MGYSSTHAEAMRRGFKYGCALGAAHVVNVQVLTWMRLGLASWVFLLDLVLLLAAVLALLPLGQRDPGESGNPVVG